MIHSLLSPVALLLGLSATIPLSLRAQAPQQPETPPPADYRAHEWGTFTSMVGTDGFVLEGLDKEEEALPRFVHDLLKVQEFGVEESKMPASRVTQKMETPVIYFHSDKPLRVQVMVWFQRGLMTQFYPLPSTVLPRLAEARQQRIDMSKVEFSQLTWDVDVIPRSMPAPAEIPVVDPEHPWALARQVDAAWVRTRTEGSPAKPEAEHYLFYRGLGRWQPDLALQQLDDDTIALHNGMAGELPFVAVLEIDEDGGRFAVGTPLAASGDQRLSLARSPRHRDRARLAGELGDAVCKALVRSGLELDESRAMVATWSRSWFQKDGARVIYLLPRSVTDQVLPLVLQPQPREFVRTLVGRLEFITPRAQARVERALKDLDAGDAKASAAVEVLRQLDRFREPHLRNVARNGSDQAVRALAEHALAGTSPR